MNKQEARLRLATKDEVWMVAIGNGKTEETAAGE